jgi:hypothetical protein
MGVEYCVPFEQFALAFEIGGLPLVFQQITEFAGPLIVTVCVDGYTPGATEKVGALA